MEEAGVDMPESGDLLDDEVSAGLLATAREVSRVVEPFLADTPLL